MSRSQITPALSQKYLEPLLAGDRAVCRKMMDDALVSGISATDLLTNLIWPTMEQIQQLYRDDRIVRIRGYGYWPKVEAYDPAFYLPEHEEVIGATERDMP